ncbi:hypothetical protein PVAND_010849 [Polypedilum vanderplanki]|uniref:Metalloendopeptidase n=1 Tax=Polypedilum vanderplanki TaxID=319348 RepID=A0A9J6CI41_POLVA|nr:hypothetical protein PVAND_010849 [Polypedilum vanderplanki]
MLNYILFLIHFEITASQSSIITGLQTKPPLAKFGLVDITHSVTDFHDTDDEFIWEKSGLFEGDIVIYNPERNVLLDRSFRWSNATIPFYIEDKHFKDTEIETILSAIREFHTKTCLRLVPYKENDENWITITGNENGCWSSVGMKGEGGQQLNVFAPNCVRKGIIIHEILHAAGFYHQHSATDRDEYVEILWENIDNKHASNFNKYNESVVTDYGVGYDYDSILHYSSKAFSKNGNETIIAKRNVSRLGQREGFTEKDILKLNHMYKDSCHDLEPEDENVQEFNIIEWFKSLF